jgi:hypothetical protein
VLAKEKLTDVRWIGVTDLDDRSAYRFFTVEVRPEKNAARGSRAAFAG